MFVDDDVGFDPRAVRTARRAYEDAGVVGATGSVIEPASGGGSGNKHSLVRRLLFAGGPEGTFTRFGYPRQLIDLDTARDVEFMQGCLMTARADARAARFGFDERLAGYALAEDEDFSYRLSRLGRVRYVPTAVVEHTNTASRSREPRAFGRLVVVNRAYLFRKNFARTPLARAQFGVLDSAALGHRLVNGEWAGAARAASRGSVEAWRQRPLAPVRGRVRLLARAARRRRALPRAAARRARAGMDRGP